jgi:hypothetical protein
VCKQILIVARLKTGERSRKTRLGQVHEAGRRIRRGRRSKRRTYAQCDIPAELDIARPADVYQGH